MDRGETLFIGIMLTLVLSFTIPSCANPYQVKTVNNSSLADLSRAVNNEMQNR